MVAAPWSASSENDGLGIRLRVCGSSTSRKPVSRNWPASPTRNEITVVGSTNDRLTVQPELWREKLAIGALTGSFAGSWRCGSGCGWGGNAAIVGPGAGGAAATAAGS